MSYIDCSKPTKVQVDVISVGLGAILMQQGSPICYSSRVLIETEQWYLQMDKVGLVVVYGIESLHQYLFGASFSVITNTS